MTEICLDGSRCFVDPGAAFSRLVEQARAQNAAASADESAAALCGAFAGRCGVPAGSVTAAASREDILRALLQKLPAGESVLLPRLDEAADAARELLPEARVQNFPKGEDCRLLLRPLAEELTRAGAVLFSNPCCPTSLEVSREEILELAESTHGWVIVDETHNDCLGGEKASVIKDAAERPRLAVLRRFPFGAAEGWFCVAAEKLPLPCGLSSAEQAVGTLLLGRKSALQTAQRQLTDSRDSLYSRLRKLAVKSPGVERMFRTRAEFVFWKLANAEGTVGALRSRGISVRRDGDYVTIFAGSPAENNAVLEALAEIL